MCSQVVEVDFAYPSDAIHQRWNAGFRITACASTAVHTAVSASPSCHHAGQHPDMPHSAFCSGPATAILHVIAHMQQHNLTEF